MMETSASEDGWWNALLTGHEAGAFLQVYALARINGKSRDEAAGSVKRFMDQATDVWRRPGFPTRRELVETIEQVLLAPAETESYEAECAGGCGTRGRLPIDLKWGFWLCPACCSRQEEKSE